MRNSICIRVLVPRGKANEKGSYRLQTFRLRTPLKRGDREGLVERMTKL